MLIPLQHKIARIIKRDNLQFAPLGNPNDLQEAKVGSSERQTFFILRTT